MLAAFRCWRRVSTRRSPCGISRTLEIEEKRRGRIIAERRKLGERPAGDHLLQLQQLGGRDRASSTISTGESKPNAFLPAHQGLVAEDRARRLLRQFGWKAFSMTSFASVTI